MEPSQKTSKVDHLDGGGELDGGRERDQISSVAEQAAGAFESTARQGQRVAEEQKEKGAARISAAAQAVEGAADRLRGEMPQVSELVHDMAQRLDSAAGSLREKKVDELIRQAGDFARRQPGMFFAGAVLSGFALARFLKSSSGQQEA
jgi:hypothetical protein